MHVLVLFECCFVFFKKPFNQTHAAYLFDYAKLFIFKNIPVILRMCPVKESSFENLGW